MRIGFIGLGRMGSAMAENLLKAGHEVTVYNRSPAKAEALAAKGARVAKTPAEASAGEAVFSMLADDAALEAVVFRDGGILGSLGKGAVHVSSSTISVDLSKRLAAAHAERGQSYVAAPVVGRPEAAAAKLLYVIAAGPAAVVQTVSPLFDGIGQRTFIVSETAEAANLVKLSYNFLIGAVIESVGEAMALVGKGGVDKHQFLDILTSTLFSAPIYKTYGGLIAAGKFEPAAFAAPLGLKDVRLTLAAGDELQVPLPLANLLRDRFLTLLAQGGANLDWSAIGGLPAKDSGQR